MQLTTKETQLLVSLAAREVKSLLWDITYHAKHMGKDEEDTFHKEKCAKYEQQVRDYIDFIMKAQDDE